MPEFTPEQTQTALEIIREFGRRGGTKANQDRSAAERSRIGKLGAAKRWAGHVKPERKPPRNPTIDKTVNHE